MQNKTSWRRLSLCYTPIKEPSRSSKKLSSGRSIAHAIKVPLLTSQRFFSTTQTRSVTPIGVEGVSKTVLKSLYKSKHKDLNIPEISDQEKRFYSYCQRAFKHSKIAFKECGLGYFSAKTLGKFIETNSQFSQFIIPKNNIGDKGIRKLSTKLMKNYSLVHLDISSNNITPDGILYLFRVLGSHQSLTSLNVSSSEGLHRNKIGVKGSAGFSQLFKSPILSILNISGTSLTPQGLEELSKSITNNKTLLSLNISNNDLTFKLFPNFLKALSTTNITELVLSHNQLGDEGIEELSSFLSGNYGMVSRLTRIDLSKSNINSLSAFHIFSSLCNNGVLKSLDLSNNPLSEHAGTVIYSAIYYNSALEYLNLTNCQLKNNGCVHFLGALATNHCLKSLNISKNSLESLSAEALASALQKNATLKSVDVSENWIGDEGGVCLAHALRNNTSITCIKLHMNNLKDKTGEEFAETVRFSKRIVTVTLFGNSIGGFYIKRISSFLSKNKTAMMKEATPALKQAIKNNHVDKNMIVKVQSMIGLKAKEAVEAQVFISRETKKLNRVKSEEQDKFRNVHKEYEELKYTNRRLGAHYDFLQSEIYKQGVSKKKEVNKLEENLLVIVNEVKNLEKDSKT